MDYQSAELGGLAIKHLFSTPLVTAELPPEVAAEINPVLRAMILERAKTYPSAEASNDGGWQSDAALPDWGGEPVKLILNSMRTVLKRTTLYVEGTDVRRGDIDWKINGWANVVRKGHANVPHVHPGAYWSAVYYVSVDTDEQSTGGELKLFDPRGSLPRMYAPVLRMGIQGYTTAGNAELHKPKAGQVVIFPSWLSHAVLPFKGDGERISLAFNFSV